MNRKNIDVFIGLAFMVALSLGPILIGNISQAADGDSWTAGYDNANSADYVRVSSSGHIQPGTDDLVDIGGVGIEFRDLYIDGTANIDTLSIDTAVTMPDDSITTDHIQGGSVTTPKLSAGAVTTPKLLDSAVTTPKISAGAVTTPKLIDSAVTTPKLSAGAVTEAKILDDAVSTAKIESGAVTTAKMYLDIRSERVACITSGKLLGTCTSVVDSNGGCVCDGS